MRILFITNSIFPAPVKALGLSEPPKEDWVFALAQQIKLNNEIHLGIATVYNGPDMKVCNIEGIIYYLLPSQSKTIYQKSLEPFWQKVVSDFEPDIVHIHGTEYVHGLAMMRVCPNLKYVLSIQGIIGIISRYYYAGMGFREIFQHISFRDIVKKDSIFQIKKRFERRGVLEKEYFVRSQNVIGRTSWDFVHSKILNPAIKYHFCNENLLDSFYTSQTWNISKKNSYSIFLSQSNYPIKGFHQVLKAVRLLKTDFPEIKLRVSGINIVKNNSFSEKIRLSGYGAFLLSLIKEYKLNENVVFTGVLSVEQMVNEYKNAHLFICPSSIENSPNSLGEAQILGLPAIATYAGGIPDMVTHGKSGLMYRFEENEMLAYNIRRIFEDDDLALKLSEGGRIAAMERHDKKKNAEKMISIYQEILRT